MNVRYDVAARILSLNKTLIETRNCYKVTEIFQFHRDGMKREKKKKELARRDCANGT